MGWTCRVGKAQCAHHHKHVVNGGHATLCPPYARLMAAGYFPSTGSGFTLSFGAAACMVISVIETRS